MMAKNISKMYYAYQIKYQTVKIQTIMKGWLGSDDKELELTDEEIIAAILNPVTQNQADDSDADHSGTDGVERVPANNRFKALEVQ